MLLRALQERTFERVGGAHTLQVDVRVIAATNQSLTRMVAQGTFREDLFYRLNVIPVHVPPLRERPEDIPLLASHFLRAASHTMGRPVPSITANVLEALRRYPWPGNVRELEHCMARLVVTGPSELVHVADLPPEIRDAPSGVAR
jgi:transcriptional regulator with PAS, ATPase and Fis domain